ncbi:hypothetical protein MHM83_11835 [Tenacibaculum sp. Mcav3-52]|uniref:hypothetical protein n=1 Tax=Tenacibaculum sp. Mcav3-52 TaxID=2917762 RepID=UPI001EF24DAE|nr:hypothetical protein [Tenacibaculum sp. Mcav3-52]MCG7502562.1 hypothetical protein [Tenacibaculum sp. Mcav3-52]
MKFNKVLNIIGEIDVCCEFENIFSKNEGFLVTNVISEEYFFEMTGESMYYALKEYEVDSGINQKEKKRKIVKAIIKRKEYCGGILYHNSFKGGKDTQLRSTSAAIRTLLAGQKDGICFKKDLEEVVNHHFSYFFKWGNGIWFCHDTSEKEGKTPISHIKTKYWRKEKRNTLTLNTHIDSLTTLLLLLRDDSTYIDNVQYINKAKKAIISINKIFETINRKSKVNLFLQNVDNYLFEHYLRKVENKNIFYLMYQKIIHPLFFKVVSPTLFFKNGYIGRDLAIPDIHIDYLLVNIADFLRLLVVYDSLSEKKKEKINVDLNKEKLLKVVNKAIDLIHKSTNFQNYINKHDVQKAWYAEVLYLSSFYNNKYLEQLKAIKESSLYNLETTVFAESINKNGRF